MMQLHQMMSHDAALLVLRSLALPPALKISPPPSGPSPILGHSALRPRHSTLRHCGSQLVPAPEFPKVLLAKLSKIRLISVCEIRKSIGQTFTVSAGR